MNKPLLPSITGILLAAGLSTRMGEPKQLLKFGKNTIVETVVDNMLNSMFSEVIVVVGHCAEKIQIALGKRKVRIIFNSDYQKGMLTSAQAGIRALNITDDTNSRKDSEQPDRHGFSLMLVDQPFITSDLIDKVIHAYSHTEKDIAVPSYNNRRGHPVIFNNQYANAILALSADSGGVRSLFKSYSHDIHYVTVDTDDVLRDIDYPDDYKRAVSKIG